MNSNYGPQNHHYGQPQNQYQQAPQPQHAPQPQYGPQYAQQPQYVAVPAQQNSTMKMAAGALAVLAVGIIAFVLVMTMKNAETKNTAAEQNVPQTVINIPSEFNIPGLPTSSTAPPPVIVNNPAPRVVTVPGQAPVAQAPRQQAPVQQAPQQQAPVPQHDSREAEIQAQREAEAKAAQEAADKKAADDAAAAQKQADLTKAAELRTGAANLRAAADQKAIDNTLLLPGSAQRIAADQEVANLRAQAAAMDQQAAALGG